MGARLQAGDGGALTTASDDPRARTDDEGEVAGLAGGPDRGQCVAVMNSDRRGRVADDRTCVAPGAVMEARVTMKMM